MQQTHFSGMKPVPASEKDIAFLQEYMSRLFDYLEGEIFCKSYCSAEGIRDAVAKKNVYCYIDDPNEFGECNVVIPNVRLFDITIDEEIFATYRGETGEVVFLGN